MFIWRREWLKTNHAKIYRRYKAISRSAYRLTDLMNFDVTSSLCWVCVRRFDVTISECLIPPSRTSGLIVYERLGLDIARLKTISGHVIVRRRAHEANHERSCAKLANVTADLGHVVCMTRAVSSRHDGTCDDTSHVRAMWEINYITDKHSQKQGKINNESRKELMVTWVNMHYMDRI
jgi:hypothetical protein